MDASNSVSDQPRQSGKFAHKPRSEPEGSLMSTSGGLPCSTCGVSTLRGSGLCRKCDPAKRKTKSAAVPVAVNTDSASLAVEEIGQCEFGFVPVYRGGSLVDGERRQCATAVKLPATLCHLHGGDRAASLGRTVAKAKAEAGRGECFELADSHWEDSKARIEVAQGLLAKMFQTDLSKFAQMMVDYRRQADTSSVGRFSPTNRILVFFGHLSNVLDDPNRDPEEPLLDAWRRAQVFATEPHMTKRSWKQLGRTPSGVGVPVVFYQPGERLEREDDETDEEFEQRCRKARRKIGQMLEFPLSATEGEPFEIASTPLDLPLPNHGDAQAAIDTMVNHAKELGITVEISPDKQDAYGWWKASENKIYAWSGVADGDPAALAHTVAHELGHAMLGHSTSGSVEESTADKEVAAECFAALVSAHHGIDASEASAWYVDNWRESEGIDLSTASSGPIGSALKAFDEYVTATSS